MRSDLNDAVTAARAHYPGVPVFALGESMGGAVVLTALTRADASADAPTLKADGVILVAPAVWSRGDMPLTYRAALFLGAHLVPGMILSNNAANAGFLRQNAYLALIFIQDEDDCSIQDGGHAFFASEGLGADGLAYHHR